MADDFWMRCSACRKELPYGTKHYVCSVSTCNRNRTRLVFCSVPCWDSHVATLRHRDAWAVDAVAPSRTEWEAELAARPDEPAPPASSAPRAAANPGPNPGPSGKADESEILVVISKVKKYIRDRSGMNTSDAVAALLSDHVRAICDQAIRMAGTAGRKTVLDRDLPAPPRRD
jgi:hypothetical protein